MLAHQSAISFSAYVLTSLPKLGTLSARRISCTTLVSAAPLPVLRAGRPRTSVHPLEERSSPLQSAFQRSFCSTEEVHHGCPWSVVDTSAGRLRQHAEPPGAQLLRAPADRGTVSARGRVVFFGALIVL